MKKKAFTLAEVLITLGIIGIVAALTLPSIIQKQNEKATVTKLKKFMSVMNTALTMSAIKNGPIETWDMNPSSYDEDNGSTSGATKESLDRFMEKYIMPYVKYIKHCPFSSNKCYTYERYSLDNTKFDEFKEHLVLADGSVIVYFWINYPSCTYNIGDSKQLNNVCGEIFFDTNGRKKPNKTGEDVFLFYFTKYGVVPMGTQQQTSGWTFDDYCNKSKKHRVNGYGCTAWVIYNENMDYLHCNDLKWNEKEKCK